MKRILLFMALIAFVANYTFAQGLIISEVADGTGSGGYPKYVELTNTANAPMDISGFKVNVYHNGSTTSITAYEFASGYSLPAGKSVVITNIDNTTDGQKWSNFNLAEPDHAIYDIFKINGDGNDVYELVNPSGTPVDVYGVIGEDGFYEDWNYKDSYAYRKSTVQNGTTDFFDLEWVFAGPGALVGHESDMSGYLTPGTHTLTTSTGSLSFTVPAGGENYETGEVVTLTWTSSGIDSVYIQGKKSDETRYETLMDDPIDATTGTFDIQVPTDAEEGDYQLRLVCKEDPTLMSESGVFHITDIHFGGLEEDNPFYPENGATDVPTDMFTERMEMRFKESVQPGAVGKIYIKRLGDDMLAKEFDVTDPSQVSNDPNEESIIFIYLNGELDPNTEYYVTVDAGAIIDRAPAKNECPGISDNSTWRFTTGGGNSIMSIYNVQYTTDPSGNSPLDGQQVKIKGVVMARSADGYFIQDNVGEWNGIYINNPNNTVSEGDLVSVIGTVDETDGLTQLNDLWLEKINSTGNTLYSPVTIVLSQYQESFEGVLVKVEDVTCSNPNLGSEWEISDGTSTGNVTSRFYTYSPSQDEAFTSITGIYFNEDKVTIAPRSADDIVTAATKIKAVDSDGMVIGPNPVINDMIISARKPITRVQVMNYVGQTIEDKIVNEKKVVVPASGMLKGIYLVRVTFADGTYKVQKVIKR